MASTSPNPDRRSTPDHASRQPDPAGSRQARTGPDRTGPDRSSPDRSGPDRSSTAYPEAVDRLVAELARLPGIGRRTAERLAFHVLKSQPDEAMALARAIADVKRTVRHCSVCYTLTDDDPCRICADPNRDRHQVLVVEQPKDQIALEQTGMYRGLYHILMGRLSPIEGVGPAELTVERLFRRFDQPEQHPGGVRPAELILGLNPTLEGDGTGLYLSDEAQKRGIRVSRLARGLPAGSQLEYASKAVLADAITGRQSLGN